MLISVRRQYSQQCHVGHIFSFILWWYLLRTAQCISWMAVGHYPPLLWLYAIKVNWLIIDWGYLKYYKVNTGALWEQLWHFLRHFSIVNPIAEKAQETSINQKYQQFSSSLNPSIFRTWPWSWCKLNVKIRNKFQWLIILRKWWNALNCYVHKMKKKNTQNMTNNNNKKQQSVEVYRLDFWSLT